MQNYVYRERARAVAARQGEFRLAVCDLCGFAWNSAFDAALLNYDAAYDNAVPSVVMDQYYREIAAYLACKYELDRGPVVDIGCGNGAFLRTLTEVVPGCRGLGVDPALANGETLAGGRIRLVKGVFSGGLLTERPSLFVSRHVLEHIPAPLDFVRELGAAVSAYPNVPFFIEVPDTEWIIENQAFWDFCYEHCNYFTAMSLARILGAAGFAPTGTRVAFGNQYRWTEAILTANGSPGSTVTDGGPGLAGRLMDYARGEQLRIETIRARLSTLKRQGHAVAVWGMATKGVIFSLLIDPDSSVIDFCVDVNTNKQGCFVPISGHVIEPPIALRRAGDRALAVVVMNTNYLSEIRGQCGTLGLTASFFGAGGAEL